MSIFNFFRSPPKTSATQAKERLQIVMAHERSGRSGPDFLPMLQQELLAVIAKYVDLDENKVEVKLDRGSDCSTLEVNIELPSRDQIRPKAAASGATPAKPAAPVNDAKDGDDKPMVKAIASVLTNGGLKGRR